VVLIYRMLRNGTEYVAVELDRYEAKMKAQLTAALERNASALGYQLTPKGATALA
jgi:hypothetical protein